MKAEEQFYTRLTIDLHETKDSKGNPKFLPVKIEFNEEELMELHDDIYDIVHEKICPVIEKEVKRQWKESDEDARDQRFFESQL